MTNALVQSEQIRIQDWQGLITILRLQPGRQFLGVGRVGLSGYVHNHMMFSSAEPSPVNTWKVDVSGVASEFDPDTDLEGGFETWLGLMIDELRVR